MRGAGPLRAVHASLSVGASVAKVDVLAFTTVCREDPEADASAHKLRGTVGGVGSIVSPQATPSTYADAITSFERRIPHGTEEGVTRCSDACGQRLMTTTVDSHGCFGNTLGLGRSLGKSRDVQSRMHLPDRGGKLTASTQIAFGSVS